MALPAYVGRYEVRDEIASGGFAVVLRAWDEELHSFVALKILHTSLAEDEEIRLRFLEEARLLRRIRSPNVVTVHDVGRLNDGRPYFVMDFADRGTVGERLSRPGNPRQPDTQSILALADAMADGLGAVHEAGVVHRDIKPANLLVQLSRRVPQESYPQSEADITRIGLIGVDERVIVSDLGIAKDLAKRAGAVTITGGTPLYRAPEQEDPDANITPAADSYSSTALLWHVLTGTRPPLPDSVEARLEDVPVGWRDMIRKGMALEPEERFASMGEWRDAIYDALTQETARARRMQPTQVAPAAETCPYKGLAAYQPEDAPYFFGREALIDELIRRMQLHKVLVVGGPSGSGKSSLVRAGLIPALRAGALPGSENWQVTLFTPGRDPIGELYYQVAKNTPSGAASMSLDDLVSHPTLARHLRSDADAEQPLVVCVDQFEELFTLAPPTQRRPFVEAISAMTDPADSNVRVVITVRADFYAACAQLPWLAERITDNQVLVGPMTGPELRRAITEPARRLGLVLEAGLVDAVIDETGEEAGSLPLVAHAMVEVWMRRKGHTLTLEGFRAAGGVAGAISQTADDTFEQRFQATERDATRRLFLRLVTPGEGTPDMRRAVSRSEIDNDPDPQVMQRVVQSLTEARLLTVDDTSVQIAHEALLRTWPRLRDWIEGSRDDLRMRQRISRAAGEWDTQGRDPDLLYRGTPLLSATEWSQEHPDQLDELERSFLDAAEQTRKKAQAATADRERRTRRARSVAIAALAVLAIGTTAASVLAVFESREAQRNKERAERATAEAHIRFAGALGAVAHGLAKSDPLLAVYLAAEAVARAQTAPPGYDARSAMVSARRTLSQSGPFLLGSPIAAGDALAIALSPDGSLIASAQREGIIELIDATTRRRVGPGLRGHEGGVRDVAFGPQGEWLVSGGTDGTVRVWPVADGMGGESRVVGETGDVVMGVAFAPDGKIVSSANGDGTVQLWNADTGGAIGAPLTDLALGFKTVQFSPDGSGIVAGYNDGSMYGWSLPSGQPLFEPIVQAHTSNPSSLVFDRDAKRFASSATNGTAMLFDYPRGQIVGPVFQNDDHIGAVVFAADGRSLIGAKADGALELWNLEQQRSIGTTPSAHSRPIVEVQLSGNGKLLATLGDDQLIRTWTLDTSYPAATVHRVTGNAAKGVAFSVDGRYLAAGDDSGQVHIWDLAAAKGPMTFGSHEHQVWALAFSPGAELMASGDRAGHIRLWDPATQAPLGSIDSDAGAIWSLAFTADGERLLSVSDEDARVWGVNDRVLLATLRQRDERNTRGVLSPDGTTLAVTATDGMTRLWDIEKGSLLREFEVDDDVVWSAAFSPDGKQLATASSDEVVAIWDLATGRQQAAFTGETGGATDVAYLADGVTVITVDRSGGLHFWDALSGRRLSESWQGHAGSSWRIATHPDGVRFATAGDDGVVKVWDELSVPRACEIGRPAFDVVRRQQYLGDGEQSIACARNVAPRGQ
ncbi:MAG: protein kinase domain-containing protein [Gammaproteobacteria bacterium]